MAIKSITRVSTDAAGVGGNDFSWAPRFSPDGNKMAFESQSSNLVPGDVNGGVTDIFVKDLATGAIALISTAANGVEGYYDDSYNSVFSPDGSKIAFESRSSNLVPGDTNGESDVFIKDLATGIIERISTDADGMEGNDFSSAPMFSPDGSKVAFQSTADNLVPGDVNGGVTDIFVKDLATGAIALISTNAAGEQGNAYSFMDSVPGGKIPEVFSSDGSRIAFSSYASNLVPGDNNYQADVFVKNLATGASERISTDANGVEGNRGSGHGVFSPDGSKAAFWSVASNLVPGDTNGTEDIFIKNLATGASERISTDAEGVESNGWSYEPMFSPDGSKLAFGSGASNLVPGDTNGFYDIFLKDLATGAITRISTAANGVESNGGSSAPVFSPDGNKVAFESTAFNLVPDDNNYSFSDIFVVELDDAWVAPPINRITGTARSDRLVGTDGNDVIDGLAGYDRLMGKDGNDVLLGGRDNDWLDGGAGDDTLIGGQGIDKLTGEQGADLFVIDARSLAQDIIFDFRPSEGDRLSLGPLIDSLGLRDEPDLDTLVGAMQLGKSIRVTLDTNGADERGGVKAVALLLRPEASDPQLLLDQYVTTDPLVLDHGDYWS